MPDQGELLDLAIGRIRDAAPYWNFYIVVASAIIALMASGRSLVSVTGVRVALAILFGLFAAGNIYAIHALNEQRGALLALVTDPALQGVVATLRPEPMLLYVGFHLVLDIAVVVAILKVPWPVEPKR